MLQTAPPPISMDKLAMQLSRLPSLPMHSFWALWDEYFDERPRRRSRTWLEACLAHKIQEVALAEYEMELRVARKLHRARRTRAQRQIQRGNRELDVPQNGVKPETMAIPPVGINALINSYLTLCPDLTPHEALWLVCRVPSLRGVWNGLAHDRAALGADSVRFHRPTAPTHAD
jgi:hypothetical protein